MNHISLRTLNCVKGEDQLCICCNTSPQADRGAEISCDSWNRINVICDACDKADKLLQCSCSVSYMQWLRPMMHVTMRWSVSDRAAAAATMKSNLIRRSSVTSAWRRWRRHRPLVTTRRRNLWSILDDAHRWVCTRRCARRGPRNKNIYFSIIFTAAIYNPL